MKKNEVQLGGVYSAKVSDKLVAVRIDGENRHGGWNATNLATGRTIRIKSPARLRGAASVPQRTGRSAKTAQTAAITEPPATEVSQDTTPSAEQQRGEALPPQAEAGPTKISVLDAAAKVLAENGQPMNAKAMIRAAEAKGYWTSPGGKTPHATLYSAIIREIATKGSEARFRKADRGKFELAK